jgi:glycosyltransferase involved in cell wall biosynthesis
MDPSMAPEVSVVLPTYRRPALLRRCLVALRHQTYPASLAEVIVVEDGGPGGGQAVVREVTGEASPLVVRYLAVPHGGPAAARNAGWRAARGRVIAFTDDDAEPEPGWLEAGMRAVDAGADVVTGRTLVPVAGVPTDAELNVQALERGTFLTCNAFCRRVLLEAVGGFDPRFGVAYREDSDLEFALLETGARLVREPRAVVCHPARPAPLFSSLGRQRNQQFDALLYKKHPALFRARIRRRPPCRHYLATACLGATLLALAGGRRRLALAPGSVWLLLTAAFLGERLHSTRHTPIDLLDMALTSLLIPPLAVYWRLRGAWHYRVPFL